MKDDTISRQGVLRLLNTVPSEEFATKAMLIGGVNALPPAQPVEDIRAMCGECDAWNQYKNYPQPGWIPCSPETMPQESGEYLVTIRYEDGYDTDLFEYNSHWREWNDGELYGGRVIAWQPKPKPWKGGQDV